jgi:hypothetical protein
MKSLYMARYFFISAVLVLVAALAWLNLVRIDRK